MSNSPTKHQEDEQTCVLGAAPLSLARKTSNSLKLTKKIASQGINLIGNLVLLVLTLSFPFLKPVWNPNSSSPFCHSWNQVRKPWSETKGGTSLVVQGQRLHSPNAGGPVRSHVLQLRVCMPPFPHDARKTERSHAPQLRVHAAK